MFNIKSKKAIADIVVVTLIIALSVIAVAIVWSYVSAVTSSVETQLSPFSECINHQSKIISVEYNEQEGEAKVSVERAITDENIGRFTFNIDGKTYTCGHTENTCTSCNLQEQGTKDFYFPLSEKPSEVSLTIDTCNSPVSQEQF
jgi:hypothetical protein